MIKWLIDGKSVADKIDSMINSVVDTKRDVANGLLMANQEICKACVEDRVDAIPVDWLKKHGWYGVIEHWEKDQKLNNSKEVLYSLLKDHGFNSYGEYINWAEAVMAIPRDDKLKIWQEEMENETN